LTQPSASARELTTFRLLALADGIFAIAMTLLVFEIKVPTGAHDDTELAHRVLELWPKFASCGLSFLTLGFSWIGHHNQYVAIRRADRTFLWINVAFLSAIALVPFSSALLGEYPLRRLAVITYAGNLAVAGTLLFVHWAYATGKHRLVDSDISRELVVGTRRRVLSAPAAYLAAIALSFLSVKASLLLCLLVPVYFMLPGRVDRFWAPRSTASGGPRHR
jgi:uncharacterized membrane protein